MFIILAPHFKNPTNIQWRSKIQQLKEQICIFNDALISTTLDPSFQQPLLDLVSIYLDFIDEILEAGTFQMEGFLNFTAQAFTKIKLNMANATREQANRILPAMLKWKRMLGPEEWSKIYVVIPTVWPVALNSPRLQLFHRLIDPDKLHTHIITSEYPRSFEEARTLLGRVVGDRSVGRLVFGTRDTKAKMKVLALSSRTDVVADDFELALNDAIAHLPEGDRSLVNAPPTTSAKTTTSCPMRQISTCDVKVGSTYSAIRGVTLHGLSVPYDIFISAEGKSPRSIR